MPHPTCKKQIYTTVLRPTIMYTSAVRATAETTHMHKLQAIPNWILRMALNAPWFARNTTLHEDAGLESLMNFIRRIGDYNSGILWRYPQPRSLIVDHQD
ncbi:hypothetical protein Trydic_g21688 [Trypoxylus dichotomus]